MPFVLAQLNSCKHKGSALIEGHALLSVFDSLLIIHWILGSYKVNTQ